MASQTGKSGPDPYLGYTPKQVKVHLSGPARDLLGQLAKDNRMSNSAYVMTLLAQAAGVPLEQLRRDDNQEVLPQSA